MKTPKLVFSAIVLFYFVENAKCGLIKSDLKEEAANHGAKSELLDKLYDTLISGYEAATQILDDMLNKDEEDEFLEGLYRKLEDELKKLEEKEEYILADKPALAEEVEESRKTIEQLIEEHKRIHTTTMILDGAAESAKNAKLAQKVVKEGPDAVRHRLDEIDRAVKDHDLEEAKRLIANQ